MTVDEKGDSSFWSREQDKAFENAIATYPEELEDRWEKITADVPGKTLEEIKHHYELLSEDIKQIEAGCVPLPSYSSSEASSDLGADEGNGKKGQSVNAGIESNHGSKASKADQERRKGIAWTEDEHRLFLLGLEKYGKGDWRSISRNYVVTRTPTQVASHAQKYFIRLNSMNKDRRRSSIHDITSVNSGEVPAAQGPITGETNAPASGPASGKSEKQATQPLAPPPTVGVYGTPTIGQPIGGPLVSAVGTPVNLSAPPHLAYSVRVPVPGSVVPGAPMGMTPMTYPMPHTSGHRERKGNTKREKMGGGHGGDGTTYKGMTLHAPKRWHSVTGKGMCAIMWFWVLYRAKQDGPVVLGWRHPWDGHDDHGHGH